MAQTTSKGIRRILGSVKVEIADLGSSDWQDLGPGEGAGMTEEYTTDEYIPDNAATYGEVLLDQIDTVDFAAIEPDFTILQKARGNIDTLTVVEGSIVSGHAQTVASGGWKYNVFIPFNLQNADGTKPTMDITHPCLAGTDGDLTEGTDFYIIKTGGLWGAVVIDSTNVTTESQLLTFKYSATPAAAYEMSTGGANEIGFIQLRLTNSDANGKLLWVHYYRAQCIKGFQLKFGKDKETVQPLTWVLQFKAVRDETRTAKDQLRKIHYEL